MFETVAFRGELDHQSWEGEINGKLRVFLKREVGWVQKSIRE